LTKYPKKFILKKDVRRRIKTESGFEIDQVLWFTHLGNSIGIVLGKNEVGEKKAYIGEVSGLNEEEDALSIANWGAKLHLETLKDIIEYLTPEEKKK